MSKDYRIECECDCGCGELKVSYDPEFDEETIFISYVIPAFYAYQHSRIDRIKNAFKMFWKLAVLDREFSLYEVIMKKTEFQDFVKKVEF